MVAEEDSLCQSLFLMLKYFRRINEERDKEEERSINSNKVRRHNAIQIFKDLISTSTLCDELRIQ